MESGLFETLGQIAGIGGIALGVFLILFRKLLEKIEVPGATTSGLIRPSLVGPRPLNAAIPSGSSAQGSEAIGSAGYRRLHEPVPQGRDFPGRLFSDAPTVMQFFAVPGASTDPESITPIPLESRPGLPAAKQTT